MKILVAAKRVPDPDTRIRVRSDGAGIATEGVRFALNPFDAIALEAAIRLKEQGGASEIVVVGIDAETGVETLRAGLAMGADRAVLVREAAPLDPFAVAKLLAAVCRREQPQLILMGKQAIDDDCNQTGQMLAARLGIGQATFVSRLDLGPDQSTARCGRETASGTETVTVTLPAVVTVDLRLNEPRYVTALGILRAKKKPIQEVTPAELGVDPTPRTRLLHLAPAPRRKAGVRVQSVDELLARLRDEARVV